MKKYRKYLLILLLIGVIAALTVGGTIAYFTGATSVTGNSISTGTVQVALGDTTPIQVAGLMPGDPATIKYLIVENTGTAPEYFRVYLTNVGGTAGFGDQLQVRVTQNPSGGPALPSGYTVYGPSNHPITGGSFVPLSSIEGAAHALTAQAPSATAMDARYATVYKLEIQLPFSTPNTFNGASYLASIQIDATQSANQTNPVSY